MIEPGLRKITVPQETKRSRISILTSTLVRVRRLWGQVELLEQLRTERDVSGCMSEPRLLVNTIRVDAVRGSHRMRRVIRRRHLGYDS